MLKPTRDPSERFFVNIETYAHSSGGSKNSIRARILPNQGYRGDMAVECPRSLRYDHPIGTRFKIEALLKIDAHGRELVYTYKDWDHEIINS